MRKLQQKVLLRKLRNSAEAVGLLPILRQVGWPLRARQVSNPGAAGQLDSARPILVDWPEGLRKPSIGLVRESARSTSYWPKYERFCRNNSFPYQFFDIHKSGFMKEAKNFDIIVWRTLSRPAQQWEAMAKIELLDRFMGKKCLPSCGELWAYEDKVRQQWLFETNALPCIRTFISYSEEEAMEYVRSCAFPIVSKEAANSGSEGVMLLQDRRSAERFCRSVFGRGRATLFPYLRQKDYVYFQEFVPNHGYDLRVIVVGNSVLGYFRTVPEGDFRASGSGLVEKADIPEEAMRLAIRVKSCLPPSRLLAVDLLKDSRDEKFYVIEVSIFISVETCVQLKVDGQAGRYLEEKNAFRFEPGQFWLQELALQELMREWIAEHQAPSASHSQPTPAW